MFYSDEYKDLKLKKCAPLHKCAECKSFNDEIGKCKDPVTMKDIRRRRDKHFADVKLERLEYHRKKELARKHGGAYLSMIIDGMDQAKTNLPGADGTRNSGGFSTQMKTRVIGVIVHGRGVFNYIVPGNVPHTMDVIFTIFLKVLQEIGLTEVSRMKRIFLQLDNTWADNKTVTSFALLSLIAELGILPPVEIGCLPVGHTHADVDQMFGVLARHLKRLPANSLEQLQAAVLQSYSTFEEGKALPLKKCYILPVTEVLNFREFLGFTDGPPGYRFDHKPLAGVSKNHAFLISGAKRHTLTNGDETLEPVIEYKEWVISNTSGDLCYVLEFLPHCTLSFFLIQHNLF